MAMESIKEREKKKKEQLEQLQENPKKDDPSLIQAFFDILKDLITLSFLKDKAGEDTEVSDEQVEQQKQSLNNEGQMDSFLKKTSTDQLSVLTNEGKLSQEFAGHFQKEAKNDANKWFNRGASQNDPNEEHENEVFLHDLEDVSDSFEENNIDPVNNDMDDALIRSINRVKKVSEEAASGEKKDVAVKINSIMTSRRTAAKYIAKYAPDNGDEKNLSASKKKKIQAVKNYITTLDNELIRMGAVSADYNPVYYFNKREKGFQFADMKNRRKSTNEYHPQMVISNEEKIANNKFSKNLNRITRNAAKNWSSSYDYDAVVESCKRLNRCVKNFSGDHSGKSDMAAWSEKVKAMLDARKAAVEYTMRKRLEAGIDINDHKAWRSYKPRTEKGRMRYKTAVNVIKSIDEELARMGVCPSGTTFTYSIQYKGKKIENTTATFARGIYNKPVSTVNDADMQSANNIILKGPDKPKQEEKPEQVSGKDERIKRIQEKLSKETEGGKKLLDDEKLIDYAVRLIAAEAIKVERDVRAINKEEALDPDEEAVKFNERVNFLKERGQVRDFVKSYIGNSVDKKRELTDKMLKDDGGQLRSEFNTSVFLNQAEEMRQQKPNEVKATRLGDKLVRQVQTNLRNNTNNGRKPLSEVDTVKEVTKLIAAENINERIKKGEFKPSSPNEVNDAFKKEFNELKQQGNINDYVINNVRGFNKNNPRKADTLPLIHKMLEDKGNEMREDYGQFLAQKRSAEVTADKRIEMIQDKIRNNRNDVLTEEQLINHAAKLFAAEKVKNDTVQRYVSEHDQEIDYQNIVKDLTRDDQFKNFVKDFIQKKGGVNAAANDMIMDNGNELRQSYLSYLIYGNVNSELLYHATEKFGQIKNDIQRAVANNNGSTDLPKETVSDFAAKLCTAEIVMNRAQNGIYADTQTMEKDYQDTLKDIKKQPDFQKTINMINENKQTNSDMVDFMLRDNNDDLRFTFEKVISGEIEAAPQQNPQLANNNQPQQNQNPQPVNVRNNQPNANGPDLKNNRLKVIDEIKRRTENGTKPNAISKEDVEILFTKLVMADTLDELNDGDQVNRNVNDYTDNNLKTVKNSQPPIKNFLNVADRSVNSSPQQFVQKMVADMLNEEGDKILSDFKNSAARDMDQQAAYENQAQMAREQNAAIRRPQPGMALNA